MAECSLVALVLLGMGLRKGCCGVKEVVSKYKACSKKDRTF